MSKEARYDPTIVRKCGEGIISHEGMFHIPIPKSAIQFIMFSGKGGVGKTTIASATALTLADLYPKKRILLFSTDPAHSLSDCLDIVVGNKGQFLKQNLYVQEMDAEGEYYKLKRLYSDEIKDMLSAFTRKDRAVNIVFEKEIIVSLMDITPPGIDEVMAVTKIIDYMDKGSFDIFILDTAPTGHLIRFLEMPELAQKWLKFFFTLFLKYKNIFRLPKISAFFVELSKNIKRLLLLLRDHEKSLFIPIAVPTEMAFEETIDLINAIQKLGIPHDQIIMNMVHPPPKLPETLLECSLCFHKTAYEEKILHAYEKKFSTLPFSVVHRQEKEVVGMNALQLFGKKLYGIKEE